MLQRPRALPRQPGAAFTLIELILVVALVSLLLGAVAFNFGALSRGQSLEEGASQFEALLRLSRANAAATGRPVLLALLAATNAASDGSPAALSLAVLSQSDPLRQPDLYRTLPSTQYLLTQLADLIRLEIPLPKPSADPSDPSDPSDQATPPSSTRTPRIVAASTSTSTPSPAPSTGAT